MKTKILLISTLLFAAIQLTSAQVLYSENFDNLVVGNVGIDDTGNTSGKGGWYTQSFIYSPPYVGNNDFKIIAEPSRGNVLQVTSPSIKGRNRISQRNLELLWNNRIAGNDVLKIEYEFFTGNVAFASNAVSFWNELLFDNSNLIRINHANYSDLIYVNCWECIPPPKSWVNILQPITVPKNTWLKFELYLDYGNEISYFTISSLGINAVSGWFSSSKLSGINLTAETLGSIQSVYKFDNFIISAVDNVPLSTQNFISDKFNLYPNPSNNIINITNSENIGIEEIKLYDISGKLIETKTYNMESTIQLDVSAFATGTYLLHIYTRDGTAVKKVIKN